MNKEERERLWTLVGRFRHLAEVFDSEARRFLEKGDRVEYFYRRERADGYVYFADTIENFLAEEETK